MAQTRQELMDHVAAEVKKYRDIYVPVRTGLLTRMLVKRLACMKIHPNPNDEFCMPAIGPNFSIISKYQEEIRNARDWGKREPFAVPLVVERIQPDGYLLLNGHHRWAAAIISNVKKVPVKIVNVTHEMDVKRMLWNSRHEKRAALDLDEVVFGTEGTEGADALEKPLPFPFSRFYKNRLRLGIPALFRFLAVNGYDIWVYSSEFYSMDYIRQLFNLHHVRVTGIVTGTDRKQQAASEFRKRVDGMIAQHYPVTLSIDREALLRVDSRTHDCEEFALSGSAVEWSHEIIEKIGRLEKS